MPAKKPPKAKAEPKLESHETASTIIGAAYTMPDEALELLAAAEEPAIDFQALQDSISEKRRGPGPKLERKSKTRAKPSPVKETKI
ncbi:MAG TPA: hypothetical protein VF079_06160 [Sphingomicrobium sp.]